MSFVSRDAAIQYLDFYAYLKDVLAGTNSITYSFGKTLGGNMIAVFSYYLSSPLMLLVIFFEKTDLGAYFDLVLALRMGISALTMRIFLEHRFDAATQGARMSTVSCLTSSNIIPYLLSVCYAISQYTIAQACNIMWLVGVEFLPLILLGVYKVVRSQGSILLPLSVGFCIIFNWYSGAIDCVFSIIWIVVELVLYALEGHKLSARATLKALVTYGFLMLLGVALAMCLFLPTVMALKTGNRGSFELSTLFDLYRIGPLRSAINGLAIGTESTQTQVSLYCGGITFVGCTALFVSPRVKARYKVFFALLIALIVSLFYVSTCFFIFSLFKSSTSYWFRYSFVGIFGLIFVAGYYFCNFYSKKDGPVLALSGLLLAALLIASRLVLLKDFQSRLLESAAIYCLVALVLAALTTLERRHAGHLAQPVVAALLVLVALSETGYSARLLMASYISDESGASYATYYTEQETQISELKNYDSSLYRVTETSTLLMKEDNLTANYNEALGYNYWSIAGYTSSPDDNQRALLERLGYRICGENLNVTNTSITAADSLLGVKYILGDEHWPQYQEVTSVTEANGKTVYENPYALPLAYTYQPAYEQVDLGANSFEYQNNLYSALFGQDVDLYTPDEYTCEEQADGSLVYRVSIPEGNYVLYGNLPWNTEFDGTLDLNGKDSTSYARWLSPSVFYVQAAAGSVATVSVTSENQIDLQRGNEQFYVLNLDVLAQVSSALQTNEADSYEMENGKASIQVSSATAGEVLVVSIPYDAGWTITRNGEEITPELFADCLYQIGLTEGENIIEMRYQAPGLKLGVGISVAALVVLLALILHQNRSLHKD